MILDYSTFQWNAELCWTIFVMSQSATVLCHRKAAKCWLTPATSCLLSLQMASLAWNLFLISLMALLPVPVMQSKPLVSQCTLGIGMLVSFLIWERMVHLVEWAIALCGMYESTLFFYSNIKTEELIHSGLYTMWLGGVGHCFTWHVCMSWPFIYLFQF